MQDLVLNSTHHQRYQNGIPVMGPQYCNRMIKIENKIFEKSNERAYHDLIYILGSKKEIIKRNFLGGIARGIGIRNRGDNCNDDYRLDS